MPSQISSTKASGVVCRAYDSRPPVAETGHSVVKMGGAGSAFFIGIHGSLVGCHWCELAKRADVLCFGDEIHISGNWEPHPPDVLGFRSLH